MATTTVYPNGDGTLASWTKSSGSDGYVLVDEGTATPNDTDQIYTSSENVNGFLQLQNMPSDLSVVTAVDIKMRVSTGKLGDYATWNYAQIVGSDETTALTSTISMSAANGVFTPTTYTFTPTTIHVTDKTSWDGARLKFRTGTGTSSNARLYTTEVVITYTASSGTTYTETGSGGVVCGSSALVAATLFLTSMPGVLAGSSAVIDGSSNLTTSGGVVCGGVSIDGKVYNESTSGGVTLGGSYSSSTLMIDLVGHWKLNEETGTRYDSHWDNDLTETNSVGFDTGKLGNAASFVSSANEYLSINDNEHLNLDGQSFTISCWVKFDALTNTDAEDWVGFLGKGNDFGLNQFTLSLAYRPTLQRIQFGFADNAGNSSSATANTFGVISTGVWYFVLATYNASNQAVSISVNDVENTATSPYVIFDNEYPFNIGRMMANRYNFSGKVDSVSLWKRVLTTAEKTQMYNSGVGWDYVFDFETEDVSTSGGVVLGGTNAAVKVIVPTTSGGVTGNGGSKKNYICGSCCPSSIAHDTFWDDDEATLLSHESSNGFWAANLNLQIYSERVLGFVDDQQFATLNVEQADYTINQIVAGDFGIVAIVFRYVNGNNHWRFVWEPENECIRLLEVTGGMETQKGFALVTTTTETDYSMNVLSYGDEIICSFDGTELTTTSSTFNTMTNVGFMIHDMGCEVAEWCCQTPVHNVLTSGGAFVGGTAINNVDINQDTSGGVLCDGVSDSDPYFYNEGDGGALAGGTAVVGHGLAASGGALAGGLATVTNRWNHLGIGGGVVNGSNSTVYNITGSGGVICQSAGYSTGLQFRKLLTIAPLYSLENFPFMFKLNVQTGLTISEIKATTSGGAALPAEYISYTDGKLCGMVRTNIDATLDTEVYIYYGGN